MGDRLTRSMEQLSRRLGNAIGVTVTYNHYVDNDTIISVSLTQGWTGRTAFRVSDHGRSRLEWSDRDYMVPVDQLKDTNGNRFQPARGDYIEETMPDPASTQRYEVFAPNDEKVWRYSDTKFLLYRIHTKRV